MKRWNALQNSWRRSRRTRSLGWLGALLLGALLLGLYVQVLQQGMARAEQLRMGQRTTTNTNALAQRGLRAPH